MCALRVRDRRVDLLDGFLTGAFADNLHAKRIASLADGTLGVMAGASVALSMIGLSLAEARGLNTKASFEDRVGYVA